MVGVIVLAKLRLNTEAICVECVEPEGIWTYEIMPALLSVDKYSIATDGIDAATVTAKVHPDLAEITFYHADTGEPIATVPINPATHTATLQVTATTPGTIHIRAGEPTITRLNEVVITAQ